MDVGFHNFWGRFGFTDVLGVCEAKSANPSSTVSILFLREKKIIKRGSRRSRGYSRIDDSRRDVWAGRIIFWLIQSNGNSAFRRGCGGFRRSPFACGKKGDWRAFAGKHRRRRLGERTRPRDRELSSGVFSSLRLARSRIVCREGAPNSTRGRVRSPDRYCVTPDCLRYARPLHLPRERARMAKHLQ